MRRGPPLVRRFLEAVEEHGPAAGSRVVVAVSGGLDSCALLHLLRFGATGRYDLVVAHFDHRWRAGSGDDALWVRGLSAAWGVPCVTGHAEGPVRTEAGARDARYAFLDGVVRDESASAVLTAHHADDQAETVLFRLLRGAGFAGVAGIPRVRDGTVVRPLLDVWRDELRAYARSVGLAWRVDPSNAEIGRARNALRHRILPDAEKLVAPAARRSLVRLARVASTEEAAWSAAEELLLERVDLRPEDGGFSVDRDALAALAPPLGARLVRALARRCGVTLDERATRLAAGFAVSGVSGGRVELGRGIELRRSLGRLVVARWSAPPGDRPLTIADPGPGEGDAWLGGRRVRFRWRPGGAGSDRCAEPFSVAADRFPIVVRGRREGDRIRLDGGRKKLKKLLVEARIPFERRARVPVVVDAAGEVLWVPGVARSAAGREGEHTITIGME